MNICSIDRQVAVYALASACDALAARDLDTLDETRLRADVEALTRIAARVTAERLRCVAPVAPRAGDRGRHGGCCRPRGGCRAGRPCAKARLASSLADPGLQATAAALAAGRISPGQADALAQAARSHEPRTTCAPCWSPTACWASVTQGRRQEGQRARRPLIGGVHPRSIRPPPTRTRRTR
ncbi:MAG: hypothetical protein ACRDZ4_07595 [Egibacteraceae bacterium]